MLDEIYRPITARPYRRNKEYVEAPPCKALRPYIRCFWGSPQPFTPSAQPPGESENPAVTPDTCMDIIVRVDLDAERIGSLFCGIDDRAFQEYASTNTARRSIFGIRFYFWAVPLFSVESMREVSNLRTEAARYFGSLGRELEEIAERDSDLAARIPAAESCLLRRLNRARENPAVMNALHAIFRARGNLGIVSAAREAGVSSRHLERLFAEYTGLPPKRIAALARYQYLLSDLLSSSFDVQDAVLRYGYTDQPHLLRDFRRFHGMTPSQARKLAMSDFYNPFPGKSGIL